MQSKQDGSTVAQLKNDIERGRTRDKVAGFDPAAAPLGTDDEAAGTPPTPETVAQARVQEQSAGRGSKHPNGASPSLAPDARGVRTPIAASIAIGLVAALILVGLLALAI